MGKINPKGFEWLEQDEQLNILLWKIWHAALATLDLHQMLPDFAYVPSGLLEVLLG